MAFDYWAFGVSDVNPFVFWDMILAVLLLVLAALH